MSRDALDFSGQQTLVVGGSTGIGNAVARAFLHHGSTVHVTGTRASASDYRPEEVSDLSSVGYSQLDLGKRSALRDWSPPFSALNTLVLCHAHTKFGGGEYDSDTFRDVVEVNLNSMFDCAERFKPMLAEAKGSVIIVSSLAAFRTIADQPAYTASKSALLGLVRALSIWYIKDGIRVNGIAPGLVETKMGRRGHDNFAELIGKVVKRLPMKRTAEPEEMAGPVLFLASPLASYIIGQTLIVDGGMSLTS
jgi:3-oxoacyl-[acyl-carrier protein] reductase